MAGNQQFCLRWNNHQSTLISVFDNLLESGTLVDCTLAAEGQYLKAHKVVLSACSPFFEGLFSQHYEKHPIIILKDVTFAELKAMLDYMYRGEVNISQDQLGTFLKAAESLQIKGLTDNSGNGDLYRKPPPEPRRIIMPPISKSPGFPTGLVVEPRPPSVKMTNNNVDSPPRRKRRLSEESLPEAPAALVQPQVAVGEPPTIDDYLKLKSEKSDASVNNYDSGDDNAPYPEEDDEEEMDLSKPGTSSTPNNHPPGGWSNQSNDNTSEEPYPPGGSQEGGLKFMSPLPMASWDLWASMQPAILQGALNTSGLMAGGDGAGVECTKCGRHYKLKSSLRNHQKWECGKEPQFQCPYCNYRAKQKMHVARHIERMHREKLEMLELSERASLTVREDKEVAQKEVAQ
uniref:Longitudinals lacking protein, isoforms H/M/V n=1 Tax=Lygus hesperus TaxID=30085 RepID=A0A0A9X8V3_LYGHE